MSGDFINRHFVFFFNQSMSHSKNVMFSKNSHLMCFNNVCKIMVVTLKTYVPSWQKMLSLPILLIHSQLASQIFFFTHSCESKLLNDEIYGRNKEMDDNEELSFSDSRSPFPDLDCSERCENENFKASNRLTTIFIN